MPAKLARPDAAPQHHGPHPLPGFLALALEITAADRTRMAAVLAGIRAYQQAPRPAPPPPPKVAARIGAVRLIDHARTGRPVVLIPSLINSAAVLDLAPGNSLVQSLARAGLRPLTVDWGTPGPEERALTIDGLITRRLLPLLDALNEPAPLVGYCLGGTIALAAAALKPPPKLALIATPWDFHAYPSDRRAALAELWRTIAPAAQASGVVPVDFLQPGFWSLDPQAAIAKFERFSTVDPTSPEGARYVAVEDWVNSGPALPAPAAAQIFERFYAANDPPAARWRIDYDNSMKPDDQRMTRHDNSMKCHDTSMTTIAPEALTMPMLNMVSTRDKLVPQTSSPPVGEVRHIPAGHVGMIVGGHSHTLLHAPLAAWLKD